MAFPPIPDTSDNLYYAKNFVTSALSAAITMIDVTITVNDVSDFPDPVSDGKYLLLITDGTNKEIVIATAIAGSTITVTRAEDGTSASAFGANSLVSLVVSAAYHNTLVQSINATQQELLSSQTDLSDHITDTSNPHNTSVTNLNSGTLADLNSIITDATLDDVTGTRDPNAHTHTESEITDLDKYTQAEVDNLLDDKINKPTPTGVEDNLVLFDNTNNVKDSGILVSDVTDTISDSHIQNTDTILDEGGTNETTAADIRSHIDSSSNPHAVTKTQIGLSNVPNVDATDADNVVYDGTTSGLTSTDVQGALDEVVTNIQNGLANLGTDDVANDSTVLGVTTSNALEGLDTRVTANDAKVSADGSVTTHNDVSDAGSGAIITTSERNKLAALESSKYLGTYVSLVALQTAHPSPAEGSYGDVDQGVGFDVVRYIWDSDDNMYIEQSGVVAGETPASIKVKYESNANTNAFTDGEQTKLTGIETGAQVNTVDTVNGQTGSVALETLNIPENTNLYYTEARVSANTNVVANTAKVSADGSVTTHSDVTNAGSGAIITSAERTALGNSFDKTTDTLDDITDGTTSKKVSSDEKDALQGTNGTPSDTNRYVTDSDSRLTGVATHATTHEDGGSDQITGTNLNSTRTATNYTSAGDTLGDHLGGIDTELGNKIGDAAADGNTYARQNNNYVSIQGPLNQAHNQNGDTLLASGTANEVSAADLRTHLDGNLTQHGVPVYPNDGEKYILQELNGVLTWVLDVNTTERMAEVYQSSTTTTLVTLGAYVPIVYDTVRIVGSDYTYNVATGEFTFNKSGWYKISYAVTLDKITGVQRNTSSGRLVFNGTSINGSYSAAYHRNTASGEGTLTSTILLNGAAGFTIGVQAAILSGNGTLGTITGTTSGCNFTIIRIA